jgi:hypothetical protein
MKASIVVGVALTLAGALFGRGSQDPGDMAKEMEKVKKWTEPGKNHETLKKFLGSWTTETKFYFGDKASPASKGTAEGEWLMEGRWIRFEAKGELMGKAFRSFTIVGYDNFKMSYVATTVSTFDTAMIRVEGDLDQAGKSMIAYGTLDEYLTGEHDKAIKVAWRFESADRIVMEVHDFAIGETNTKVFEIAYARKK